MLFPFKIPLGGADLTGPALGSSQIPHEAASHVNTSPSSHPRPWEQHPHFPPATTEWAEMGCGQEQAAEPLAGRLSGQIQHCKRRWKPVNTN